MRDGELTALLGMAWDDKVKVLVDVDDWSMQKLYSDLKLIKERVRNPLRPWRRGERRGLALCPHSHGLSHARDLHEDPRQRTVQLHPS